MVGDIDVHPLLEKEAQEKARKYETEKRLFGLAGAGLSLGLLLVFSHSGLSARAAGLLSGSAAFLTVPVYAAILITFLFWLGLPLAYLEGFKNEHRWGFSNQALAAWLGERLKSYLLSLVLGTALLGLFIGITVLAPRMWWLTAAAASAFVGIILATLFPIIILPLFNTYTPIEDEALTAALARILDRGGLRSSGFFKQDMSRQTKKENAFLSGIGKTRRVILSDNLMNHMSVEETEAVIAHEVGHFRYKHLWKSLVLGTGQQVILFFLLDRIMGRVFPPFPGSVQGTLTSLPWLFIIGGGISGLFFGPLDKAVSRYFEKQADGFVLSILENVGPFQTALAGLADRNLSNAYPPLWIKILFYSHPPIGERLKAGDDFRYFHEDRRREETG